MKQKDVLLSRYLSDNRRYADLWNGFFREDFIEADALEVMNPVGVQKNGSGTRVKKLEHDLMKKHKRRGCVCILGVENQEAIDYRMVIRSIGYGLEACQRQVEDIQAIHIEKGDCRGDEYISKMKKEDILQPVAILILYFGKKPWDGATDLYGLFGIKDYPEQIREVVPNYRINLLDVNRFEHLERFHTDLYLVFGFLQRRWNKKELRKFIEEHADGFHNLKEDAYDVIQAYGRLPKLKEQKEKYRTEKGDVDMCQAWNEIMKEERQKGKQQGRREGKREGKKEGEEKMGKLIELLMANNRSSDVMKVIKNRTYRRKLYQEYKIP